MKVTISSMGKCKLFLFFHIFQEKNFDISYCKNLTTQQCISIVCVHAKSLQLCPTLSNGMDCSPPGSSVLRILQSRILEQVFQYSGILENSILQRTFPTQGSNPCLLCLLHCQAGVLLCWHPLGSPYQH